MRPVDTNRVGIVRIARAAQEERFPALTEDEELGKLLPQALSLERRTGKAGQQENRRREGGACVPRCSRKRSPSGTPLL